MRLLNGLLFGTGLGCLTIPALINNTGHTQALINSGLILMALSLCWLLANEQLGEKHLD